MPYDFSAYTAFDPRDYLGPSPVDPWTAAISPQFLPAYYRDNFLRGEALPYYLTQFELKSVRDRHRKLVATNPFAVSALSNRAHYIVGDGLTIKANPIEDGDESLASDVQKFIDVFVEVNDLNRMEAEAKWREDEDGEAFVRLFPQRSGPLAGMTYLRFVEPELVRDPRGDATGATSFGIETMPGDVQHILGYQIVDDPITNYSPGFVAETEVVHFKGNTRATAKRGLPKLYQVEASLKRAEDLLASMSAMAKTRAKIAMIRSRKGTNKTAAQTLADDLADVQVTDPVTGAVRNVERYSLGSIIDTNANTEYIFPNSGSGVAEFVMVLQAELRSAAALLNMPEWMLTADSGNANYSTAFVAESVAVKSFQAEQERIRALWAECRFGSRKSVIWRALEVAIDAGIFPEDLGSRVRIVAEAPSLIARDQDREASTNKLYFDMKVKSRQRIQQELGFDGEREDEQILNDEVAKKAAEAAQTGDATQRKQPVQQQWQQPQTRLAVNRGFGVAEALSEMVGPISDEQLLRLAAAPPGCALHCHRVGSAVFMEAKGDAVTEWQVVLTPERLQNLAIELKPEHRLKGLSRRLFGDQEDEARKLGIKSIEVIADASEGRVGHLVWPKLGFDGPITGIAGREPLPAIFAECQSLGDLLRSPEGAVWWESNGTYAALSKTLEGEVTKRDVDELKAWFEARSAVPATQPPVAVNVVIPNDLFASMKPPDVVVNVATPPAPNVTVEGATINVPEQAPPTVNVAAPVVNVAAPEVTVEAPAIATPPAQIHEAPKSGFSVDFSRGPDGKIAGALIVPE